MSQKLYDFIAANKEKISLSIDMTDVDFIDKYENAFLNGQEKEKALEKTLSMAQKLKATMQIHDEVIDDLFGEGTAKILFGDSKDYTMRINIISQIIGICKKQNEEINKMKVTIFEKYRPKGK